MSVKPNSYKRKLRDFVLKTARFCCKVLEEEYGHIKTAYESGNINDYELFIELLFFSKDKKEICFYADNPIGLHEIKLSCNPDYILARSFSEACPFEVFWRRMNRMVSSCLDVGLLPDEETLIPSFSLLKVVSYYQLFDELKGKVESVEDIREIVAEREYQLLQLRNEIMKRLLDKCLVNSSSFVGFRIFMDASISYEIRKDEFSICRRKDVKYLSYYISDLVSRSLNNRRRFKRFSELARLILVDVRELMDQVPGFDVRSIKNSLITLSVEQEFLIS